jgi:hypothetical protein
MDLRKGKTPGKVTKADTPTQAPVYYNEQSLKLHCNKKCGGGCMREAIATMDLSRFHKCKACYRTKEPSSSTSVTVDAARAATVKTTPPPTPHGSVYKDQVPYLRQDMIKAFHELQTKFFRARQTPLSGSAKHGPSHLDEMPSVVVMDTEGKAYIREAAAITLCDGLYFYDTIKSDPFFNRIDPPNAIPFSDFIDILHNALPRDKPTYLILHNANDHDAALIARAYSKSGKEWPKSIVFMDSVPLLRALFEGNTDTGARPSLRMEELCKFILGIDHSESSGAHTAGGDASRLRAILRTVIHSLVNCCTSVTLRPPVLNLDLQYVGLQVSAFRAFVDLVIEKVPGCVVSMENVKALSFKYLDPLVVESHTVAYTASNSRGRLGVLHRVSMCTMMRPRLRQQDIKTVHVHEFKKYEKCQVCFVSYSNAEASPSAPKRPPPIKVRDTPTSSPVAVAAAAAPVERWSIEDSMTTLSLEDTDAGLVESPGAWANGDALY